MPENEEQRQITHYMVSPHQHVNNFLQNAWGSNRQQAKQGDAFIVPVFKDEQQRASFHQQAVLKMQQKASLLLDPSNSSNQDLKRDHTILKHLVDSSQGGMGNNTRFNLSGINENSMVIVQGHGKPGRQSITSDAPKNDPLWTQREQTVEQVASLLHKMKLPDANEVRANSCHSGTDSYIYTDEPNLEANFKQGTINSHHGGNWQGSFAGGLEKELVRLNHHNKVTGFIGSTSQFPKVSMTQQGTMEKNLSVGIKIRDTHDKNRYEKGGMSKINPTTKKTVENVANIQGQGLSNADKFRAKLLASHGRMQRGTHKIQQIQQKEAQANQKFARVTNTNTTQASQHRSKWQMLHEQIKNK